MTHYFIKNGSTFKEVTEDEFFYFYHKFDDNDFDCEWEQLGYGFVRQKFLFRLTDTFICTCYMEYNE